MNNPRTSCASLVLLSMKMHERMPKNAHGGLSVLSTSHDERRWLVSEQRLSKLLWQWMFLVIPLLLFLLGRFEVLEAQPLAFEDLNFGQTVVSEESRRVISNTPAVTETVFRLTTSDCPLGPAHHALLPPQVMEKLVADGLPAQLLVKGHEMPSERTRPPEEERSQTKHLDLRLSYVRFAKVNKTNIFDYPSKTLVVEFKEPMCITSTLEGERNGILAVGNHYSPPPCWEISHRLGFERLRNQVCNAIGKSRETSSLLFTGADMDNLSVQKAQFKDMTVYALVTAGVKSNAMRMAADEGRFYEPGTINMVIMTNMRLSARARARAIISATEAKTAAMQDLDVRSAFSPGESQATGTGTDEILVAEGRGASIDSAGGHCKMGELIAKAVYEGVKEAVRRQDGMTAHRSVFHRLQERRLDLHGLLGRCDLPGFGEKGQPGLARLEELLLQPRYASFLEAAFVLSDAYERGQVADLTLFEIWCRNLADEISGNRITQWTNCITSHEVPVLMRMSLNALLNGLAARE